MTTPRMQRFWDALPRLFALVACVLMLWPLAVKVTESHQAEALSSQGKPVKSGFTIIRSEIQADVSAPHWAMVVVVQGRQVDAYPVPQVLAIVSDGDGNEVFQGHLNCDIRTSRHGDDGLRTWIMRSEQPRTLAAIRYHTLTPSLIDKP